MTGAPRKSRRGNFGRSMSSAGQLPRATLELAEDQPLTALRERLAEAGCPNPVERASELVLSGSTRFYRGASGGRDEAVVVVTLGQAS